MRKLRSSKVRARRVPWFVSLTQPRTHTHSETRRHFPVQLSSLNVTCCCLLFNLCFTTYRMCHMAELIPWLENSFLAFFFTSGLFLFLSDLDLVTNSTFSSSSYAEEWNGLNACWSARPGTSRKQFSSRTPRSCCSQLN